MKTSRTRGPIVVRLAALVVAALSPCACGDEATEPSVPATLDVSFPGKVGEIIPYRAGGPFVVRIEATMPEPSLSTRARVDLLGIGVQDAGPPSAFVVLAPQAGAGNRVVGEVMLQWSAGGSVPVSVQAVGLEKTVTAPLAPQAPLSLTFSPATDLPPVGELVSLFVDAKVGDQPSVGTPITVQTVPVMDVLSAGTTNAAGRLELHFLSPKDVRDVRVEASAGTARAGLSLRRP